MRRYNYFDLTKDRNNEIPAEANEWILNKIKLAIKDIDSLEDVLDRDDKSSRKNRLHGESMYYRKDGINRVQIFWRNGIIKMVYLITYGTYMTRKVPVMNEVVTFKRKYKEDKNEDS